MHFFLQLGGPWWAEALLCHSAWRQVGSPPLELSLSPGERAAEKDQQETPGPHLPHPSPSHAFTFSIGKKIHLVWCQASDSCGTQLWIFLYLIKNIWWKYIQWKHVTLSYVAVTYVPNMKLLIAKTFPAKTTVSKKPNTSYRTRLLTKQPDKGSGHPSPWSALFQKVLGRRS